MEEWGVHSAPELPSINRPASRAHQAPNDPDRLPRRPSSAGTGGRSWPFFTTGKGQCFTSVGSAQYAGGYYWLDGTDTSVNVSGWINMRYLSPRNIISGRNCYAV